MAYVERSRGASVLEHIRIKGANAHNLKHISVAIPRGQVTLVSGPSGSGKSSLLIDTIAREASHRTEIALSTSEQAPISTRADVDIIDGLPPVFTLSSSVPASSRASIAEYLGVADSLLAKVARGGNRTCTLCGGEVHQTTVTQKIRELLHKHHASLLTLSCIVDDSLTARVASLGFTRVLVDGRITTRESVTPPRSAEVLIDQFAADHQNAEQRIRAAASLSRSLKSEVLRARVTEGTTEAHGISTKPDFISDLPLCDECGTLAPRVSPKEFRNCTPNSPLATMHHIGMSLQTLATNELAELEAIFDHRREDQIDQEISSLVREGVALGLGHLTLHRPLCTLSTGELQRVRLLKFLRTPCVQSLLILDEPTSGLSIANQDAALCALTKTTEFGTTLLIADHNPSVRSIAEHEIELGPGSGEHGGEVVYEGPRRPSRAPPAPGRFVAPPAKYGTVEITRFSSHNIRDLTLSIPLGRLVVVTGVSGSGKSTLVFEGIARELNSESSPTVRLHATDTQPRCVPLGRLREERVSGAIIVGSYVHFLAPLREFFAKLPLAKVRGYTPSMFSPLSTDGDTARNDAILEVKYRGYSIKELLSSSVASSRRILGAIPKCAHALDQLLRLNLGYLHLDQPIATLSVGERQRVRLARSLAESKQNSLFLFDEPSRGLDENEAANLTSEFHSLVARGHSIIAVEHNPIVIGAADVVIEMGPGAGNRGGKVIAVSGKNL